MFLASMVAEAYHADRFALRPFYGKSSPLIAPHSPYALATFPKFVIPSAAKDLLLFSLPWQLRLYPRCGFAWGAFDFCGQVAELEGW
jgi:hypothetical protein